jgi:hypothetical protein
MNPRPHAHPVRGLPQHGPNLCLILIEKHALVPGDNLRLLNRIKILPLQILLCADGEQLGVVDLANDNRKQAWLVTLRTDLSPRHPAAMSVDKLIYAASALRSIAMGSYNQHALEACFAHPLRKIRHAIGVEGLTSLVRAILDQCVRHLLHSLVGLWLAVDDLIDRGIDTCLSAPTDPRAPFAAHR